MNISACTWEVLGSGETAIDRIKIHRMEQLVGNDLFAVRAHGCCLNKDGKWEYEPQPSSRDDSFMNRCRYASFKDAVSAIEKLS